MANGVFKIDAAAQLAGKTSMMNPSGGKSTTGHTHEDTQHSPHQIGGTIKINEADLSVQAKEGLNSLVTKYLLMKDALVRDDMSEAQEALISFKKTLAGMGMSQFKGESHNVWMQFSEKVNQTIAHAEHHQNIEELRQAFLPLSSSMIVLAKAFNPLNDKLYIQHCPMADNNNGGDWLSLSEEVRNPYFGASMLKCGEVTEEINH